MMTSTLTQNLVLWRPEKMTCNSEYVLFFFFTVDRTEKINSEKSGTFCSFNGLPFTLV